MSTVVGAGICPSLPDFSLFTSVVFIASGSEEMHTSLGNFGDASRESEQ